MWEYANGIDESPVCRYDQREPMKIGRQTELPSGEISLPKAI